MRALIPNLITLANLLCGTTAIICSFGGYMEYVPYLVLASFVADFFDGFVARWLGVASPMGKELDSLADMVSFGVLPGIIMYHLLNFAETGSWFVPFNLYNVGIALIVAGFAAYRLAKFNVDTRSSYSFFGIPTPTTAAFITALLLCALYGTGKMGEWLFQPAVLWGLGIFASIMMVVDLPMMSNKVPDYSWGRNKWKYLLLITTVILIVAFGYYGVAACYFAYILFSLLDGGRAID